MTTLRPISNGTERAQDLGIPLGYATTRTTEASVTMLPDGRYHVSVSIPLAEVKPVGLELRVKKALQNGFEPKLTMPGSTKPLDAESVEVSVSGKPPTLHVEADFEGSPLELVGKLNETKALDVSFTHPRGMPEFRVEAALSDLTLDRTPAERDLAQKAVVEAKENVERWKSEFEDATAKAPGERAALESERATAAQSLAEAEASFASARGAIDARADDVHPAMLAAALRAADAPEGKQWLKVTHALAEAREALESAEEVQEGRATAERAGVDPDEVAPRPDLDGARARVEAAEAAVKRVEGEVRAAFKKDPTGVAHFALAQVTGDASDHAREAALETAVTRLSEATAQARQVAEKQADDPNGRYPQLIAAAEADVRRLEAALTQLEPVVKHLSFEGRGDDQAQRALFGVPPDQSWEDWRRETIAAGARSKSG